jgi:hypothetical protein
MKSTLMPKTLTFHVSNYSWGPDEGERKFRFEPLYVHGDDWLKLSPSMFGDSLILEIHPQTDKMIKKHGFYEAYLLVYHEEFINSPHYVKVRVDFPWQKPSNGKLVYHDESLNQKSDYFWLSPEFPFNWSKGQKGNFMINGMKGIGEYLRYVPYLEKGNYQVSLVSPAYAYPELAHLLGTYDVWVRHVDGKEKIRVNPSEKLEIGQFSMDEHSYVEVVSDGEDGLILMDAVFFEAVD